MQQLSLRRLRPPMPTQRVSRALGAHIYLFAILLLCAYAAAVQSARISDNLLLRYGFLEGAGTTAADSGSLSYVATLNAGRVSWIPANAGLALAGASGTGTGAVTVSGSVAALRDAFGATGGSPTAFTLDFWVRPDSLTQVRACCERSNLVLC